MKKGKLGGEAKGDEWMSFVIRGTLKGLYRAPAKPASGGGKMVNFSRFESAPVTMRE